MSILVHFSSLWDTAGSEDYDRLRPLNYPDTNVLYFLLTCMQLVIMAFSVVSPSTYCNVKSMWIAEIRHYLPDAPIVLVGLKTDLRHHVKTVKSLMQKHMRIVSRADGEQLAKEIKALCYVECSSKYMDNVDAPFKAALYSMLLNNAQKKKECNVQ